MISIFFCALAFSACMFAGTRSLRAGLLTLIGFGYVYGIIRANYPDAWTYLMFDAGVISLCLVQLWRPLSRDQRARAGDLKLWLTALVAWPALLFFLFPSSNPLVELVGLRGNVFLLPFLLLGARLESDDLFWLAERLALLNIAVVAFAVLQYFVGIEQFFPKNEVTEIIYKSRDVVNRSAHRIPSSFSSAHAFAGTLVMTLPLLLGVWSGHKKGWRAHIMSVAVMLSLLGIFIAAARLHVITAGLMVLVVTLFGTFVRGQRLKWAIVLLLVGYVVAGNARLQRFTTLGDTEFVSERIGGSVNEGLFDLMGRYPLGNGLAGGGTSIPYFLREEAPEAIGMESEYARIALEQGVPGLVLWLLFVVWIWTRRPWRVRDEWSTGRLAGWAACVVLFAMGFIGTGLLTSVPQTVLMLLMTGWIATARRQVSVVAFLPRRNALASAGRPTVPQIAANGPSRAQRSRPLVSGKVS